MIKDIITWQLKEIVCRSVKALINSLVSSRSISPSWDVAAFTNCRLKKWEYFSVDLVRNHFNKNVDIFERRTSSGLIPTNVDRQSGIRRGRSSDRREEMPLKWSCRQTKAYCLHSLTAGSILSLLKLIINDQFIVIFLQYDFQISHTHDLFHFFKLVLNWKLKFSREIVLFNNF